MKILSRFVSPAGFALVLLLFFLLPFVSVSCDVPDYGRPGVSYTGSHLVSGTDPEAPTELRELSEELREPGEAAGSPIDLPDPGVRVLAIVLAVLAAAGVLTGLLPQVKARLLGAAALATTTLVVAVVTMVVAQSNLRTALITEVRESELADQDGLAKLESAADEMTRTETGFWLMMILLALLAVATLTFGLFGDRLRAARSSTTSGGLPLGKGRP